MNVKCWKLMSLYSKLLLFLCFFSVKLRSFNAVKKRSVDISWNGHVLLTWGTLLGVVFHLFRRDLSYTLITKSNSTQIESRNLWEQTQYVVERIMVLLNQWIFILNLNVTSFFVIVIYWYSLPFILLILIKTPRALLLYLWTKLIKKSYH